MIGQNGICDRTSQNTRTPQTARSREIDMKTITGVEKGILLAILYGLHEGNFFFMFRSCYQTFSILCDGDARVELSPSDASHTKLY
jgi:hypothetical protein